MKIEKNQALSKLVLLAGALGLEPRTKALETYAEDSLPLRKRLLDNNQLTDMSNVLQLRTKSMKPFSPQKGHTSFALRAAYL